MNDRENLLIVKNELTELDRLCQHFQDCYNALYHELRSEEDKEEVSAHFFFKESDIFEYRKQVTDWITSCEYRLNSQLDRASVHSSRKSRLTRSSKSLVSSSLSERTRQKEKVAELMAERSLLKKNSNYRQQRKGCNWILKSRKHKPEKKFLLNNKKKKVRNKPEVIVTKRNYATKWKRLQHSLVQNVKSLRCRYRDKLVVQIFAKWNVRNIGRPLL